MELLGFSRSQDGLYGEISATLPPGAAATIPVEVIL
ncbi:hypothetical protein X732_00765 [Mesorhizobium sp. L2C066B000]|nr:hypothetical protein X732_00765 [Mesorhizobium sp. L2C066B000]